MANYDFSSDRTDKRVRQSELSNNILNNVNFVVNGCEVTADGSDMQVDIASGDIFIKGTGEIEVTGTSLTLTASDPSNDRCDLIVVNTSGVVSKIDGTAATPPLTPAYDEYDYVVLAFVIVQDGVTVITNNDVFNIGIENGVYDEVAGKVTGISSSTDNNIPQWDGVTGKLLKDGISPSIVGAFKKGTGNFTDNDTAQTFSDAFCTADSLVTIIITDAVNPQGVWIVESSAGSFTITSTSAESTDISFDYYIQKVVG